MKEAPPEKVSLPEGAIPKSEGQYAVQAGAFSNRKNAYARVTMFKKFGYEAFLKEERGGTRTIHIVIVHRFASKNAAARLVEGRAEPLSQVPYVWSYQFEMRIAIAGDVAGADVMHVCHGALADERFLALFGRDGKLVGAVGMKRPRQLNACREAIERGDDFEDAVRANA